MPDAADSRIVVLIDRSLDQFGGEHQVQWTKARAIAQAIATEVSTSLIVVYDERAAIADPAELSSMSWAFIYGTNLAAGLDLARQLLEGPGMIRLVTYSAPSSFTTPDGRVYFNPSGDPSVRDATLEAAARCATANVRVDGVQVGNTAGDVPALVAAITGGRLVHDEPA